MGLTSLNLSTPEPTILQSGIDAVSRFTGAIPPGKNTAVVFAFDKKGGAVPWMRFGVASRVNDVWSLGAGIEARAKDRPTMQLYSMWTW